MTENPDILLLQETKCAEMVVENLLSKCWKKSNFMFNDSRGRARGLAILWNPTIIIIEYFYSTKWTLSASYRLIRIKQDRVVNQCLWVVGPPGEGDIFRKPHSLGVLEGNQKNGSWGETSTSSNPWRKRGVVSGT
jgi:exonuclease III